MKQIAKVLIVIGMVCFLFPFVTVSCSVTEVEVTGVELMTAITSDEELAEEVGDDVHPNVYLLVTFGCGIVALVLMLQKKLSSGGGLALVGAVFLLIFRMTFADTYLGEDQDYFSWEFQEGWTLSLVAYAGAAACAFFAPAEKRESDTEQSQPQPSAEISPPIYQSPVQSQKEPPADTSPKSTPSQENATQYTQENNQAAT